MWYPFYIYRYNFHYFAKILFSELWRLVLCVLYFSDLFALFFPHVWRYRFETLYIRLIGGATGRVRVTFQWGRFDLLYSQSSSAIFLYSWPQKFHRALIFCTHAYIVSILIPIDILHDWAIVGFLVDKNTLEGKLSRGVSEKFSGLFHMLW